MAAFKLVRGFKPQVPRTFRTTFHAAQGVKYHVRPARYFVALAAGGATTPSAAQRKDTTRPSTAAFAAASRTQWRSDGRTRSSHALAPAAVAVSALRRRHECRMWTFSSIRPWMRRRRGGAAATACGSGGARRAAAAERTLLDSYAAAWTSAWSQSSPAPPVRGLGKPM